MKGPQKNIKLAPPGASEPTLNMTGKGAERETTMKPLQIKVPLSKHKEMKAYAAEQGISMTDMIMQAYELYRSKMN